jgi:hypothetical protein
MSPRRIRTIASLFVALAALPALAQQPPRPQRDIPQPQRDLIEVPRDTRDPREGGDPWGRIVPRPGPVQTTPLGPPGGTAVAPPAAAPAQPEPGGVPPIMTPPLPRGARTPPAGQPAPDPRAPLPPAASDETVVQPPEQKIANQTAVFSGLDKITGRILTFDVAINETVQYGALQVTPRACYTRPPTETQNTTAFVEVDEITLEAKIRRIFSGWMFAASPGLHAVEHAIYDVWLVDCKPTPPEVAKSG